MHHASTNQSKILWRAGKLRRAGFTYAEMLVVILMLGILWSVAMPNYAESTNRTRVAAAAMRVAAELNLAHRDAKYRGVDREVSFNVGSNQYELVGMKHPDKPSANYVVQLDEGLYAVDLTAADFSNGTSANSKITFDMFGKPLALGKPLVSGMITVAFGDQSRSVLIDPVTGKAELQ